MTRNLINLNDVGHSYGSHPILDGVTLGVHEDDHIGIVGLNGEGKSTLLRLICGFEEPLKGSVTRTSTLTFDYLKQQDSSTSNSTVEEVIFAGKPRHEWLSDSRCRSICEGLVGGVDLAFFSAGENTLISTLSGGELRRLQLARTLIESPELLVLDEPTNHLDLEAINWLAGYLSKRKGTLLIVTHDRWFLDEVCTKTWEVSNQKVRQYEGGYAAYILAKNERLREEAVKESKRQNLMRKELAWLSRGAPARTSKAKYRIDAANELIANEPPVRNAVELVRFASKRLGDKVIELDNVSLSFSNKAMFEKLTWNIGPGDRIGVVGANGAGKTTLLRLLSRELTPDLGRVDTGSTVHLEVLGQQLKVEHKELRVIESLDEIRQGVASSDGYQYTARQLCDRFGFTADKAHKKVHELSGGEQRRLQIMQTMMKGPNVLFLDEPTNDLDTDTLVSLEDLFDSWAGTLVVVSHDRYFLERVCDNIYKVENRGVRHLPSGVSQYLKESQQDEAITTKNTEENTSKSLVKSSVAQVDIRKARKDVVRLERIIERLTKQEQAIELKMTEVSGDFEQLQVLVKELSELKKERAIKEAEWIDASEIAEASIR